jgi:hypothetical protein
LFTRVHRSGCHHHRRAAGRGARAIRARPWIAIGSGAGPLAGPAEIAASRDAGAGRAARSKAPPAQAKTSPDGEELLDTPAKKPAAAAAAAPALTVACSGPFAKDSSHLKLAIKYDSRNLTFGEVDGPEGSKIPGTILFPNDPKRRLEVIWAKEGARSETSVIAINGKSQWSAPKGMKLGLPLAALEKANGRPFKLSDVDADGTQGVAGWEGGAGPIRRLQDRHAARRGSQGAEGGAAALPATRRFSSSDAACARSNRRSWKS